MKTVRTKKVDGIDVIVGLYPSTSDPVETEKIVKKLMDESDLIKQKKALQDKFQDKVQNINAKIKLFAEGKATEKTGLELKALQSEADNIIKQMADMFPEIQAQYKKLYQENIVYFETGSHEQIVEDDEADEIIEIMKGKEPDEVVTREKKKIRDLRQKSLWKKENNEWTEFRITKLGQKIPRGFSELKELHEQDHKEIIEQTDINRVHGMPQNKREDEYEAIEKDLKAKVPLKVIELELEGDTHKDALEKAQKWFDDEKKRLKKKYLLDE